MSRIFEISGKRGATVTDTASISRDYCCVGYSTEEAASTALATWLDTAGLTSIGGNLLSSMTPQEIDGQDGNWIVTVNWTTFRPKDPTPAEATLADSPPEFNFEFNLASEKIYLPIGSQTVHKRTADTDPLPSIALIGDQGDGKAPSGVDLLIPTISQSETRFFKQSSLTESDRNTLLRLLGKVNTSTFRGWDAGEVLFAGVSGRARGRDDWELNFRYLIRENTSITVDGFDSIDKLGWEYVWPRYLREFDGTAVKTTSVIQFLVLAQVYETASFAALE